MGRRNRDGGLHMTQSIRVLRIDIIDPDGVGPLQCSVGTQITTDDPVAVASTGGVSQDSRGCLLSRAAFNALIGAMRRPSNDGWPDGALAHPVTKLP